ncbi:MAG TPA: caspase family protein [Longimicrobium sp.]|nr:caspase family protein [Longimicrobium sp.]
MSHSISLHVGVWKPGQCDGDELSGPRADPFAMAAIAHHHGFQETFVISGPLATWPAVQAKIQYAIDRIDPGGVFLLTFSGHGTHADEARRIQTWCMATEVVPDRDIFRELKGFSAKNVRVILVSSSCFSGGLDAGFREILIGLLKRMIGLSPRPRALPLVQRSAIETSDRFADGPSVLLLASSRAYEKSKDDTPLTLYTQVLWDVWDSGRFPGTLDEFAATVRLKVGEKKPDQTPVARAYGPAYPWGTSRPFAT